MLSMGLYLAAILLPVQLYFGHLNGDYIHEYQPGQIRRHRSPLARRAAQPQRSDGNPRSGNGEQQIRALDPRLGSLIASMSFTSKEVGLTNFSNPGSASCAHPILCLPDHGPAAG